MKKSRIIMIGMVLSIIFVIVMLLPQNIIEISSAKDVRVIIITNEETGEVVEMVDQEDIQHILDNLNGITFHKGSSAFGFSNHAYGLEIKPKDNKKIEKIRVITNRAVIYRGFYYIDEKSSIDFEFIEMQFNSH